MNAIVKQDEAFGAIEAVLMEGDLSKLNPEQRVVYYNRVCESVGLNPLTRPFDYIRLNGKLTLYAKRDCADQLRAIRGVSVRVVSRENIGGVYVVTARAVDKQGREDESTGAVAVSGLNGESLANAYMKAETKAKRRVTLSLCGLGILDESEIETIPTAEREPMTAQPVARITGQSAETEAKPNGKTNGATSKEAQAKAWVEQQRAVLETLADNEDLTGWKRENAAFIERLEAYPATHDYLQALMSDASDRINARN